MTVKIHKIKILPAFLYGCETYSLTLRKGHRKDTEKMHRIFEPKSNETQEAVKKYTLRSFFIFTLQNILLGR
jgi:hypothetical protein